MKLLFVFMLLLIQLQSVSYSSEFVTLAVEDSWPPYSDSNGNGISKDIIQKALDSVLIQVEFITVPYARALRMVESGEVDGAFNVTKQKNTSAMFKFGKEPILSASASFYFPRDTKLSFSSIESAPDQMKIGLIIDYEYGDQYELHKARFHEVRVANQTQIIQMLENRRVDVAIMFDEVAKYTLSKMKLKDGSIVKGNINHVSDVFVAFNKKNTPQMIIKKLDIGLNNTKHK